MGRSGARPRHYTLSQFDRPGWQVVSQYTEEDVVEGTFDEEADARAAIPRVQAFRADQTEAPRVVVEDRRAA